MPRTQVAPKQAPEQRTRGIRGIMYGDETRAA